MQEPKPIKGFDTETINGKVVLFTDSTGAFIREPQTISESLDFLSAAGNEFMINGFWNIDYDLRAVLKFLDRRQLENFYFSKGIRIGEYKIKWIPHKAFKVKKGKHYFNFYDFSQFFGFISLDTASKKFLNDSKHEMDTKVWTKQEFTQRFPEILRYCIHDSELTARLGEYAQASFKTAGADFNKPYSCAYISEKYFRSKCYIPRIDNVPLPVLEYAFNSYRGGRFEAFRRGYFSDIYQHDIKSAYPYQIADLIDLTAGKWEKITGFNPSAYYGFYHVQLDEKPQSIALTNDYFKFETRNIAHYSTGKQTTFLSQAELQYYLDQNRGSFHVIDGYCYTPYEEIKPFSIIRRLYEERKRGDQQNYAFKIMMNSLYGKFLQMTPQGEYFKTGNLFNPVYAAIITANTRLELLKKSEGAEDSVIMYLTDSILSDKKLCSTSETLGEWNYEGHGEGVVLGSGVYSIVGEKQKNRFRGFNKGKNLFELLQEHKRAKEIKVIQHRPQGIAESILHKAKNWENMNVFLDQIKILNPNFDKKREWERSFRNFGDCLKHEIASKPFHIG